MGARPLKQVSRAVVNDDFIRLEVLPYFPCAAPIHPDWWRDIRFGPCDCNAARSEQQADARGSPLIDSVHLAQMFETGVVRWVPDSDVEAPHWCGRAFVLREGRLIYHPRIFNEHPASSPPPMELPGPRFVCEALRGCAYLFQADLKSWYYQVRLPPRAAAAFRLWVWDQARWRAAEISRLPMGWRASAAAADAVTRAMAGVPATQRWRFPPDRGDVTITYIDDIATGSRAAAERFRAGAARAGAEIKCQVEITSGTTIFLGLQLAVPGGAFRVSPRLVEKLRRAGSLLCSSMTDAQRRRVVGLCVAVLERSGMCLAAGCEVWDFVLPGRQEGVPPRRGAALAASAIAAISGAATAWRHVVAPTAVCYGASDASTSGWGWVWCESPTPRWGRGQWRAAASQPHINYLEAIGVLRAVRQAPANTELRIFVDNLVVATWVTKGSSRTRLGCQLIKRIESSLIAKGCRLLAQFIPSGANIADGLSRGAPAPLSFSLPPWQATYPRRVLGWAAISSTPVGAGGSAVGVADGGSSSETEWAEEALGDAWGGVDESD